MTAPQDPFGSAPQDNPGAPPPGDGSQPGYGYGPPPQQGYGQQPGYGAPVDGNGNWVGPPLASWGRRVGGYLIDSILVGVIVNVLTSLDEGLGAVANLALLVALGVITGIRGQTPGRQLMKISVVKEVDGSFLGAGAGVGRSFLHILDALPLLLGFLWPIWDKKNQTFADKIMKSVVIRVD